MVGYANVFFQRKDYDAAIDCFRYLRTVLRGIHPEEEPTRFDKYECILLEVIAECYCLKGEFEKARRFLRGAVNRAVRYDNAAPEEIGDMKFYTTLGIEKLSTYDRTFDLYGKTAFG